MLVPASSEQVIRRLYQITNDYHLGFETQINELITMGLERFNLDIGILSRINNSNYRVEYCQVPNDVELCPGDNFEFDATYCQITCHANGPVAIEHVGKSDLYGNHPAYQSFGLESYIGIPIKVNNELYGTLNFSSATPYPRKFEEIDIDALKLMASWIEVELIRRNQEQELLKLNAELERKAYLDSLTNIPNRRSMFKYLNKEVNRVNRSKNSGVLAILDVDFFKQINDQYGHQQGDKVLMEIAQILNATKRDYDYLARFGGEEFLLWLPDIKIADGLAVCERIRIAVSAAKIIDHQITISVGLKEYLSTDHADHNNKVIIDSLIQDADTALYQAKTNGRDRIEVFSA